MVSAWLSPRVAFDNLWAQNQNWMLAASGISLLLGGIIHGFAKLVLYAEMRIAEMRGVDEQGDKVEQDANGQAGSTP